MPFEIDMNSNKLKRSTKLPCQTAERDRSRLPEGIALVAWQCQNGHITDVWAPVGAILSGESHFHLGSSLEFCDLCEEAPTPADVHLIVSQIEDHCRRISGHDVVITRKAEELPPFDFYPWTPQALLSYGRPCVNADCDRKTYTVFDDCLQCYREKQRESRAI